MEEATKGNCVCPADCACYNGEACDCSAECGCNKDGVCMCGDVCIPKSE